MLNKPDINYPLVEPMGTPDLYETREEGHISASSAETESTNLGTEASQTLPLLMLVVAVLGFFVITFDAVVVNVALPTIRRDLGGGMTGLQWVVDGYTLLFAALLLTSGVLSDRFGSRRAFAIGLAVFTLASAVCGISSSLPMLLAARFVQGSAAAVMMPSSMGLIREAYPETSKRARAVGAWAMGGAAASSSAPVLGGLLTLLSWRAIFFVNVPVGALALLILRKVPASPLRSVPIDWLGQCTAILAMGGLTFGAIEVGAYGFRAPIVIGSFALAILGGFAFFFTENRVPHPMVPLPLLRVKTVWISAAIGFAFMVGYYGLAFMASLYFQQMRNLSPLATGVLFLPMFTIGLILTPFSSRVAERCGSWLLIVVGLLAMAVGLTITGLVLSATASVNLLSGLMVLIGLGGPLVMPMTTALLLTNLSASQTGTVSGIFNTSRQIGGALAVAVFGALISTRSTFVQGERVALFIGAGVLLAAAVVSLSLKKAIPSRHSLSLTKGAINV